MPVEEAIVLVGGLGTRLRAMISDVPKPLAPVAGRPFLAWVLDRLAAAGMRRVVLATGHMADQVQRLATDRWRGMDVEYSHEEHPLGTGGALRQAARRVQGDGVHLLNGDTYLLYSPQALEAATRRLDAWMGVALARVSDLGRYGAVELGGGRVVAFHEKGGTGPGEINAGCYFLTARALDALPERASFSLEADVLPQYASSGRIAAFAQTADFIDIGVPEDYQRAQIQFAVAQ